MKADDTLKWAHEKAVIKCFISEYNKDKGTYLALRCQRERPDFECEDLQTNKKVGVEVATLYYDEADAKGGWELARGQKKESHSGIIVNPDQELAKFATRVIDDHCKKNYDFTHPIILVLDSRPALSDEHDIKAILPHIHLPKRIPYEEIYLGVHLPFGRPSLHEGHYHVWRLYPKSSGNRKTRIRRARI